MENELNGNSELEAILVAARKSLALIEETKAKIDAALVSTEEANRKANSESGYAFNAKTVSEEHASAISKIKGEAEAATALIESAKKTAQESAAASASLKKTAGDDGLIITQKKDSSTTEAVAVHVAKTKADESLAEIEAAKSAAKAASIAAAKSSTDAAEKKTAIEGNAEKIQITQNEMEAIVKKSKEDVESISSRESNSKILESSMTETAETAKATSTIVEGHEIKIKEFVRRYVELFEKIESLLPGAASAGLASSFRVQKDRFKIQQRIWFGTFLATIGLLLGISYFGLSDALNAKDWQSIWRLFIAHLPIVGPLIWLGLIASHNYTRALRVQEEYAFKEAVSSSFEGYKREMAGLPLGEGISSGPLLALCENVLRALGRRPGLIYESHQEDLTPLSPLTKFLKPIMDKLGKTNSGKTPQEPGNE